MSSADTDTLDLFGDHVERFADAGGPWPEQLAEMTDIHEDELRQALPDLPPDVARITAMRLIARFVQEFGGTRHYIPKDDAIRRSLRNMEMWAHHDGTVNGRNGIRALARRYSLTDVAVWSILREQRRLHIRRVQGDILDDLENTP